MANKDAWERLTQELTAKKVTLIAVSKKKPAADIMQLYDLGQRHFGENYVQELTEKQEQLPADIKWHFIGHLQGNKVKYIAPFVHLIHTVDSLKLLVEINKQAVKNNRIINVLLQLYIANEETKFGMDEQEVAELLSVCKHQAISFSHVRICGLMGMASNTDNTEQVRAEFERLHRFFLQLKSGTLTNEYFTECSMGMSSDYEIAIEAGSTMVRIGSLLFGERM